MIFGEYYHALDRSHEPIEHPSSDMPISPDEVIQETPLERTSLGPDELGTGTNPMQNQLQAFNAKIREGASRIEFEFMGAGKTNSQQPGPETFGSKERRDMRELADKIHYAFPDERLPTS